MPARLQSIENGTSLGDCNLLDISDGGARLSFNRPAELPEHFLLVLSLNEGAFRRCEVRWRSETELGVQFYKE